MKIMTIVCDRPNIPIASVHKSGNIQKRNFEAILNIVIFIFILLIFDYYFFYV